MNASYPTYYDEEIVTWALEGQGGEAYDVTLIREKGWIIETLFFDSVMSDWTAETTYEGSDFEPVQRLMRKCKVSLLAMDDNISFCGRDTCIT